MLRHNLILILRNFKRFKSTFIINLIGLSTGLVCSLMIYLWVNDEFLIDKFHEKDVRLFQVMEKQQHDGSIRTTYSTPWLLAETLKEEFPEVEYAATSTPAYWSEKFTLSTDEKIVKASGIYTGKDFFNIFSYPLVEGKPEQVLADKKSIVISEDIARNLFNSTSNAIGKSITFQQDQQYLVSGVFKNIPINSSERFEIVLSTQLLLDSRPQVASWGNSGPNTFIVLKDGTDVSDFNKKIVDVIKKKSNDKHRTLFTTKFSDNYLHGEYENGIQSGGRIEYVTMFSTVAIFILIIACINFMNLSTAKASRRLKEVGVKKAVGAGRGALILQYLGESMLITFISVLLAVLMVDLLLPQFNLITGKQLELKFTPQLLTSIGTIMLFTGILAGSYPALYLSAFNAAVVLKGKLNHATGDAWIRKGLVIFQFTLSIILISAVLVIYNQIQFVLNKDIGYDKDNVIYFQMEGKITQQREAFVNEIKNIPGVLSASSIGQSMVGGGNTTDINWEGKDPEKRIPFAVRPVDYDAIEMMGLELKQGRAFSRDFTDSMNVVFNDAAIDVMGLKDPIGKTVDLGPLKCKIVGIVSNFNYESLHTPIGPLFFILAPQYTDKIAVKIEAGETSETLQKLGEFYKSFNPGFAFEYRFMDDDYQQQYATEQKVSVLSRYFASIAILISCLGLFGLAAFTAERRMKEIGIRKVLGSGEFAIIRLLSSDFTMMVLTAIGIALPIAYFVTKQWLSGFEYKIELSVVYFIGAGLMALVIAWLTVSLQTFKAARVNPAQCLKDE